MRRVFIGRLAFVRDVHHWKLDLQLRSGYYVMLVKVEDDNARLRACNIIILVILK